MRDWSSDEYKQVQVSCSKDLLSETIAIHWRIKDESQKMLRSCLNHLIKETWSWYVCIVL